MNQILNSNKEDFGPPFFCLIAAAAAQPQPDGARLSTSQWNVRSAAYAAQPRPCNRRATAAKTQPWLDKAAQRLLKPSSGLTKACHGR